MTDFLNPKSMVTPGMAGALVMFLSNAICFQFPEIAPRWAALLLSFALGAIVIAAAKLQYLSAAGFWLINSLIIFAVAAGSAGVAAKTAVHVAPGATAVAQFLIPSAYAQPASTTRTIALTKADLQAELAAANARLTAQQEQLTDAQRQAEAAAAQAKEAQAQRDALEKQRVQQAQKEDESAKKNANRFFKEWQ